MEQYCANDGRCMRRVSNQYGKCTFNRKDAKNNDVLVAGTCIDGECVFWTHPNNVENECPDDPTRSFEQVRVFGVCGNRQVIAEDEFTRQNAQTPPFCPAGATTNC